MSGVAIIRGLLAANAALIASVPASRIVAGVIPEGSSLAAIGVMEISATEVPHIDGTAPFTLVDSIVQVTVAAATYPQLKQVHALARKACNYQHGTLSGFQVVQIRRTGNGPDMSDPSARYYQQSLDFSVIYQEPNT